MNCFDFDKTIYRKDCSVKFYLYCFFRKPIMFFHIFKVFFFLLLNKIGFISTKKFKEKFFSFLKYIKNIDAMIEKFWEKELKNINEWYLDIKKDNDVICSASPYFLVSYAMKKINKKAKVLCTNMDITNGIINGENLKGENKVVELKKQFGDDVLFQSVYTDSLSDFPILDLAENKYIACGSKVYLFGQQKPTFFTKIKYIFKQLRMKHYVKNGLIFLPLFFSSAMNNWSLIKNSIMGFLAFCLIASFVYVVNDLMDVKNDRKHTTKRKRPIASYMIKPHEAIILALFLIGGSIAITYFCFGFDYLIFGILLAYAVINILYSVILKHIPIVDAFILSSCYLLRIFFGGLIISTPVSKWLYLTILCGALFMGFGKRRNEITKESNTRKVNKHYDYNFLDKNLYVCLALTLVFYSLWAIDFNVFGEGMLNRLIILATIPIIYFIMMRYSLDIEKSSNSGDPIDVLLKDKILILFAIIYVVMIIVAVYVPITIY